MAVCSNDDLAWQDKTLFWHDLMADTLLQNSHTLLTCEPTHITLQCSGGNRRGRDNMIKNDMCPLRIKHASTGILCQLTKSLDRHRRCSVMTHNMINIYNYRFSRSNRTA